MWYSLFSLIEGKRIMKNKYQITFNKKQGFCLDEIVKTDQGEKLLRLYESDNKDLTLVYFAKWVLSRKIGYETCMHLSIEY
jgi:hypothetical protein